MTAVDPRIAGLVRLSVGVDAHNHIDLSFGPDRDLAGELTRSGFAAAAMVLPDDDAPGDVFARFLDSLQDVDAILARGQIVRAVTAADIRAAQTSGRPAIVQAVEGPGFLAGRVEQVEQAWRRGVRQLGLTRPADLAAAASPRGAALEPRLGGFTAFDLDVIKACQRLGVLVDLGHATPESLRLALRVASRPMLVSRTGLDTRLGHDPAFARRMRTRLIGRDLAREIADAGGVIGVWTHLAASVEDYVANIRAMIDVVGVNHVCLGTDTKLTNGGRAGVWTNRVWAGQSKGFFVTVVEAMLKAKFSPAEIRLVGGENYLRLFEATTR